MKVQSCSKVGRSWIFRAWCCRARCGLAAPTAWGRLRHASPRRFRLPLAMQAAHAGAMFSVTEPEAPAIRTASDQGDESSAAAELRRIFPGITDNAKARYWGPVMAGWKPLP